VFLSAGANPRRETAVSTLIALNDGCSLICRGIAQRALVGWGGRVLAGMVALWAVPVHAQSIRDSVRQHVSEGLEDKEPEPRTDEKSPRKKKPAPPKKKKERRPSVAADAAAAPEPVRDAPAPPEVPPEERLPKRVFGKSLELDAKVGSGVRGWYPDQYPLVSIAHASYFTWALDLKAKLFGLIRLHRGYYESNGLKGPRTQGAVVARDVGQLVPKAAWLLGTLGVPLSRRWETLVSYEARSFVTRARPATGVAIVERSTPPDTDFSALPRSDGPLEFVSGFETLVLAVRYYPERGGAGLVGERTGAFPPMYFGVGFTQYSKPYQVRVGSDALDELLFDGRFQGAGLAYGLSTQRQIERPYVDLDAQLGLGQVRLLDDLTLNELLPDDWLLGYLQGDVTVGYVLPLLRTRPSLLLTGELSVGGATFFYFRTKEGDSNQPPALPLNWDLLWGAHVSLTLPL
jgi:hypothetical protein